VEQFVLRTLRIFPRRTNATPDDELAIVNRMPELWNEADTVQVSVTFEWDKPRGEALAEQWQVVAPVEVGGPAYGDPGGEFVPGQFLRHGYTITSRGCPNKCPRCKVPEREGALRLLPIRDGHDVLDNNLLACQRKHIEAVFQMLKKQKHRPKFTGGLEAARLRPWHVEWLLRLKPETLWMAYDRPGEWEPLRAAVRMLADAGIVAPHRKKRTGAYVLMGWRGDTPEAAEKRLRSVIYELQIKTQAMWLDNGAESRPEDAQAWRDLRKRYTDAASVGAMIAEAWQQCPPFRSVPRTEPSAAAKARAPVRISGGRKQSANVGTPTLEEWVRQNAR